MPSTRRGATKNRSTCRSARSCHCFSRSSLEKTALHRAAGGAAWCARRRAAVRAARRAGARGYMQVMPFWVKLIGQPAHNLFHLRTNLAYGCAILRFYLDLEKGDYFRALGRYNGSLGQPEYPNLVLAAWRGRWKYEGPTARSAAWSRAIRASRTGT